MLERLAVDVLHRVVIDALLLPDGEHGHDVRVMQLGGRLGFVAEAGDLPLIEHRGERQNFQRHLAIERLLVCFVDDAHAAAADLADDPILADLPRGWRCCSLGPPDSPVQVAIACRGWHRSAAAGFRDTEATRRPNLDVRPIALPRPAQHRSPDRPCSAPAPRPTAWRGDAPVRH